MDTLTNNSTDNNNNHHHNNDSYDIFLPNFLSCISFEDLGIYSSIQTSNKNVNTITTYSLISIECIILFLCIYQLFRFFKFGKLYLKKVIHVLIVFSMTVCIAQATKIPPVFEELLHEASFVFCSLIYFAVMLFWVDFYQKLTQGKGLLFLQQRTFVICMAVYVLLYMGVFATAQFLLYGNQVSVLPSIAVWWHLAFYAIVMIGMLCVTVFIAGTIKSMFLSVRIRFFKKTAKILALICGCFILRFLGTLLFVLIHYKPSAIPSAWDTPEGFVLIYLFDRIIPVLVFIIVMRKIPSNKSSMESLNFYTPLNDA